MTRRSDEEMDAFDRDVLRFDDAPGPSPTFVAELRMSLRHEAHRLESTAKQPTGGERLMQWPIATPTSTPRRPATRFWGVSPWLNRAASLGLVAALLLLSVTLLNDRATPEPQPTINAGFAVATPSAASRDYASVPMPGGNPARTNVQPGPGINTVPQIAQHGNSAGSSMVLADGVLIVTSSQRVTALDAATLQELWSAEPTRFGYASTPVVADGRIFFTTALSTETMSSEAGDFPLVALSAEDGRELWRVDGAGSPPAAPIVDGETVYSLGVAAGRYQIGAYRVSDGQAIWQTTIDPFAGCCPRIGIALADGLLAVSDEQSLSVYNAETGERLWIQTPTGERVGPPAVADDLVIVNQDVQVIDGASVTIEGGATTAYDLRTGEPRWSNESSRSNWAPLSIASGGALYAGPWEGEESGRLALLSLESGDAIWSVPLPRVEGDVQTYLALSGETEPVIVGDTAYVTVSTVPYGGSSVANSLVAAIDLATGATRWMAQIDGNVVGTPIVSGGRIFALTHDAGLTVLEESGQVAETAGTTVDLRTPVLCNALPAESPMLGDLPATPSIPGVADWKTPVLFSQIPSGQASNVDPPTATQLEQRFKEYRSCSQVDPYTSVFGFFSTDFYVRLLPLGEGVYHSSEQPWAIWMAPMQEFLYLDTNSLRMLPDGRIGGLINSPITNIYVWWVLEDGAWKIDEYHRIEADPIDPNAATPPPSVNAEGTPYG